MPTEQAFIVIPCFDEAPRIGRLVRELQPHIEELGDVEVLLINDGSGDNTLEVFRELRQTYSWVNYLSFTRNFGKEAAMLAGIDWVAERGGAVLIMDADGQHPPVVARQLIEATRAGASHVVAERNRLDESLRRRLLARVAYGVLSKIMQVSLMNGQGDFRMLEAELVAVLAAMPERNRFSKGLYAWLGDPDEVITFDPPDDLPVRKSRWSLRALFSYSIDGVTSFNDRPLRFILLTGLTTGFLSFCYMLVLLAAAWRDGITVPGYLTTVFAVTFLGSLQLVSLGVIGEYVGRILVEAKDRPMYLIRERSSGQPGSPQ